MRKWATPNVEHPTSNAQLSELSVERWALQIINPFTIDETRGGLL